MRASVFTLLFLASFGFASETMLSQAEHLSQTYAQEIAKLSPPSVSPLTDVCLNNANVWFSIDLNSLKVAEGQKALDPFRSETTWALLKELGVQAVVFEHLRQPGSLEIDPKWGDGWTEVFNQSSQRNISLVGDLVGNATIAGVDFQKALQNEEGYSGLYQLIEIDSNDWSLLPKVAPGEQIVNVPWLTIQQLHEKGYVPEKFNPYLKQSAWNATAKMRCADKKVRRWIYLKEEMNNPVLAWLDPNFSAYKLAAGDALQNTLQLGQKIVRLDGNIPLIAQQMLALWIRKIGGFSASFANRTIEAMTQSSVDLSYDIATRPALLHAIVAEDAEALRMIYRLFLEEGIEIKRLVHALQPFDRYVCDWVDLMQMPKRALRYWEEQITAETLQKRLLKEDIARLGGGDKLPITTWVDYCARALKIQDFNAEKDLLTQAHLLLAFTYAMQPGAFSFSMADLLGALPLEEGKMGALDLLGPSDVTLYASLPVQYKNSKSFASRLKEILAARSEVNIAGGKLIAVLGSANPGTLLLLHQLPNNRQLYLLALNFGRKSAQETIEMSQIRNSWPIDALSHIAEEKVFSSSRFSFTLPPLSGRAFYFQPQYVKEKI